MSNLITRFRRIVTGDEAQIDVGGKTEPWDFWISVDAMNLDPGSPSPAISTAIRFRDQNTGAYGYAAVTISADAGSLKEQLAQMYPDEYDIPGVIEGKAIALLYENFECGFDENSSWGCKVINNGILIIEQPDATAVFTASSNNSKK